MLRVRVGWEEQLLLSVLNKLNSSETRMSSRRSFAHVSVECLIEIDTFWNFELVYRKRLFLFSKTNGPEKTDTIRSIIKTRFVAGALCALFGDLRSCSVLSASLSRLFLSSSSFLPQQHYSPPPPPPLTLRADCLSFLWWLHFSCQITHWWPLAVAMLFRWCRKEHNILGPCVPQYVIGCKLICIATFPFLVFLFGFVSQSEVQSGGQSYLPTTEVDTH